MKYDDRYFEAVAEGVDRAIWRMIKDDTPRPGDAFYNTLREAAREAFATVADDLVNAEVQQ